MRKWKRAWDITDEEAKVIVDAIQSIMWCADNPYTEWDSDTTSEIATIMHRYGLAVLPEHFDA